jgi:uncharacterized Zn-binding protein involved in type VI secretion
MAFTIPNHTAAFHPFQASPDSVDFDILVAAYQGEGVVSGCAVTAQGSPNLTVAVASGVVAVNGVRASVTGTTVTITTAHGSNPRIDLITVNSSGTLAATAGTAASVPLLPSIPSTSVALAAIYVPASDTTIATNQIIDKRVFLNNAAAPGLADNDIVVQMGTDADIGMVLRSTSLSAATALAGVLVGTPVTPAVAANSLIISNITANGDIMWAVNLGGNSQGILLIDTSSSLTVFNEASGDWDVRFEGATNANLMVLDAGQDAISLGGANVDGAALTLNNLTTRTLVTSVGHQFHLPAQTQNFDNASSTVAIGAGLVLGIQTYTGANASLTITQPATLYISGIPVASSNMVFTNTALALWVDAGGVRFDGTVAINGVTYTWPGSDGSSGNALTTNSSGTLSWSSITPSPTQASASAIKAETNEDTYAPPDLIKHTPGIAKVWARWEQTGGTHTMGASYNMNGMVDGGATGFSDLEFLVDFSSGEYAITGSAEAAAIFMMESGSAAAGTLTIRFADVDGTYTDATHASVAIFGEQV